jgi:hypothetical protein
MTYQFFVMHHPQAFDEMLLPLFSADSNELPNQPGEE